MFIQIFFTWIHTHSCPTPFSMLYYMYSFYFKGDKDDKP